MALNGTLLRLKIWLGTPAAPLLVSEETMTDISFTKDTFETTSKDSGAWRNRNSSYKSAEIQCEAFSHYQANAGHASFLQLFGVYDGTVSVKCEFSTSNSGDPEHVGNYHMTKWDEKGPTEQGATVSFTLISDGPITTDLKA